MSKVYECRLLNLRITTLKTIGSMFGLNFFTGLGSFGAFLGIVIEVLVIILLVYGIKTLQSLIRYLDRH